MKKYKPKIFVYCSHMDGGFFFTNEELKDTYCDVCGDRDYLVAEISSIKDIESFINCCKEEQFYDIDYLQDIQNKLKNQIKNL